MNESTHKTIISESENLISRSEELEAFASLLHFEDFGVYSTRIYNLWGEKEVGKSTFLKSLRESDLMERKKVVWISPKYEISIDTPQEFIAACSKDVRFPNNPQREKSLSKKLEESQKGKVDPIRSDDSLLITRSSIATNKKPYINAAAAASVGRTSFVREDMEVSVGLGNNRAGNQAEAFLDALPLQSMGADLVLLHLSDTTTLSGSVRDWFRDYVIPAATKGPYRRNLILIEESNEPFRLQSTDNSWGEWNEFVLDFELRPTNIKSVISFALRQNLSQADSRFVFICSLGYPATAMQAIDQLKKKPRSAVEVESATSAIAPLSADDKARLAICSLPEKIYPSEFDAIVGEGKSRETLQWLSSLPNIPLHTSKNGSAFILPEEFRSIAISAINENADFRSAIKRWLPYARLLRNVPSESNRLKLYQVAGLNWIDSEKYDELFEEQSSEVSEFIDTNDIYFSKRKKYAHVSQRIQQDLLETATNLRYPGTTTVNMRAKTLWNHRQNWLNERIEDLEKSLRVVQERLQVLHGKHSQVSILLKRTQSNGSPPPSVPAKGLENGKNGIYIALLVIFSIVSAILGFSKETPLNTICFLGAFISFSASLTLIPGWKLQRSARESIKRSKIKNSPEFLRKENAELISQIQENESAFDELSREISIAREDLEFAYI